MKNNLISAIAGWKSAALLALIAMVAAVAFSGVLSTAQAVEPGQSHTIAATATAPSGGGAGVVRLEIDPLSTSSASFAANDSQTLVCADAATSCDVGTDGDSNPATPNTDVAGTVHAVVNIDADSADGVVIVKVTDLLASGGPATTYQSITVTTLSKADSMTASAANTTIPATNGSSVITAIVKSNAPNNPGMDDQILTFQTNLGVLSCDASANVTPNIAAATNVQWCQVATDGDTDVTGDGTNDAGAAQVTLSGTGLEGTATITIRHATLDVATVEVTLFGSAKNMTAEADQRSVEVGGSVFVVLTVTDAAGNPVSGALPQPALTTPIVPPEKGANEVTTSQAADDNDAATSPYNVNKDPKVTADATTNAVSKDTGDIPSCGAFDAVAHTPNADPPVIGRFASTGTDDNGQCVVQVNATPDDPAAAGDQSSARGVHTLNFRLTGTEGASVEVTVAGAAASIERDAPETVEPLSDTTITVTVLDEDGVLVGETDINVIKVAGDGLAEGPATMEEAKTKNGSATFSYAAGLEGRVVFRVIAGTGAGAIRDVITLMVGEAAPAEVVTWNKPLASGTNLYVWNGEDGAPASAGVPEGVNVVAIWEWTGSSWNGYFPEAAAEGITAGDLTELENGEAYFVVVQ